VNRRLATTIALTIGVGIALTACGSDDDTADASSATTASTVGTSDEAPAETLDEATEVEVTLGDFTFGDLPDEVPVGTRLTVVNDAPTELHELVAFRLADGDERPVDEIVASGLEEVLSSGPPAAVLLAAPGGEQISAVGDGTLAEAGRYLILCAIPTGADPAEYLAAAATSDGPPDVAGGPPHFVNGMVDDLVVTAG
jgi:hypothetical protein